MTVLFGSLWCCQLLLSPALPPDCGAVHTNHQRAEITGMGARGKVPGRHNYLGEENGKVELGAAVPIILGSGG